MRRYAFVIARDVAAPVTSAASAQSAAPDYSVQLALLAAIVASSDDAIVSKTLDGRILSWNAGATRIFGYQSDEVVGQPITIIIPPELHEEERRILDKVRRGERIDHFDTTRVAKDGRRIPISLTVSPVRDSHGTIIGASKVARDISDRKRAEQLSIENERQLAAEAVALANLHEWSTRLWRSVTLEEGLGEILAAAMNLLDAQKGNVQLLRPENGMLTIVAQHGFDEDFLGAFGEMWPTDVSACSRALRAGRRVVVEDTEADELFEPLRPAARAAGFRSMVSTPLFTASGRPLGIVSVHFHSPHRPSALELHRLDLYLRQASDFMQRCRMEQVLRESEEALREGDRRKDEFLALLAHELRNPLAPIRYALAANKKSECTADQRRQAYEVIDRQVTHMSRLLDDLLDVSRITRGALELKKTVTELPLIVGAALETARPLLDAKHHTLTLDLPSEAVRLEADAVRLAQVFSNLLINAAKYTDANGHIHLRAVQLGNEVVVSVRDNGIGISDDMKSRLFTMFAQAATARERAEGGLGIGLSLVRGLVTLHGGTIEGHSDGPGLGSEFIVRLPVDLHGQKSPPAIESGSELPVTDISLKILVVDDNRDAADTCSSLLETCGHHVQKAYTGSRALELAETFQPHALFLDIGLPDMDGYQIARRLRSCAWGRRIQLVAVTGWGQDEDRSRAFSAGFDHYLTKPLAAEDVEWLLESIRAPLGQRSQSQASSDERFAQRRSANFPA